MTHYTVCCCYASHYHNTVTVEAGTLDEALENAIEQASDDSYWKPSDDCGPTFVEALAEGEDADPWGDTAIPVPDRFTQNGEPPVVTLTGLRPPGGIEVSGGTVRIRFVEDACTVTSPWSSGSMLAGPAPGWCRSWIPNTRTNVDSAWLIWASAHPNQGQSVCLN